jgi:hypothetical protein
MTMQGANTAITVPGPPLTTRVAKRSPLLRGSEQSLDSGRVLGKSEATPLGQAGQRGGCSTLMGLRYIDAVGFIELAQVTASWTF